MKIRPVIVWFVEPVRMGGGKRTRTSLIFEVPVADAAAPKAEVDRLLGSLPHPEDTPDSLTGAVMAEIIKAVTHLRPLLQETSTPGLRWLNGCAEFTTWRGELLLVPTERIAWIELGAESERSS